MSSAVRRSKMRPTILVVEDDNAFRSLLVSALDARGYDTRGVSDGSSAIAAAREDAPEMAVVDLRLPDQSGLDVVRELKALEPSIAIVVLTGYGSIATALEAVRLGAVHYLTKPTDPDRILAAFDRGLAAPARELPVKTPSLARVEWEHLQRVLADCHGNISEAARALGMHRRSLQRKLARHAGGIDAH
jgi:two-component system, response regulator RegA